MHPAVQNYLRNHRSHLRTCYVDDVCVLEIMVGDGEDSDPRLLVDASAVTYNGAMELLATNLIAVLEDNACP